VTRCRLLGLTFLLVALPVLAQPDPLADYRTLDKAVTAKITASSRSGQTGYLGAAVFRDPKGRVVIEEVQPDSPADKAGIKKGDVVTRVGEQPIRTTDAFREWVQTHGPGEEIKFGLLRDGKPVDVTAMLIATSRPMKLTGGQRPYLGVQFGEGKEGEGVKIDRVTPDGPAAQAGLKTSDVVIKFEGKKVANAERITTALLEKTPGDEVTLTVRRDGKEVELKVKIGNAERGGRGEGVAPALWKKDTFRLAVVRLEFPDTKHNDKVPSKEWEDALFGRAYAGKTNVTGQAVFGSLNDYFLEQSAGKFKFEGKVFEWVAVGKNRNDYVQGSGTSNRTAPLVEALDKATARDGKDAFKDFDGYLFIYAGERVQGNRGSVYYPHAGTISHQGRRLPYLLIAEGGSKMTPLGGMVKEVAQMLGLPDLAARTENPGSEGLGAWCAMSNPFSTGRPQHLSAWAKEKLGWLKPTVIDPSIKQKLILSPIEDAPHDCVKVLVRPDGSEYFLLENRRKKGFDADLPAEGLLIWRVVNDRPILEEAHGVEGPTGPTVHLTAVPYPSQANNAFTPDTTPSSRSPLGGGLPVHITEIRRLPDGRITFHVGYEYR
jgi:M6 family metalloprotease-like protein